MSTFIEECLLPSTNLSLLNSLVKECPPFPAKLKRSRKSFHLPKLDISQFPSSNQEDSFPTSNLNDKTQMGAWFSQKPKVSEKIRKVERVLGKPCRPKTFPSGSDPIVIPPRQILPRPLPSLPLMQPPLTPPPSIQIVEPRPPLTRCESNNEVWLNIEEFDSFKQHQSDNIENTVSMIDLPSELETLQAIKELEQFSDPQYWLDFTAEQNNIMVSIPPLLNEEGQLGNRSDNALFEFPETVVNMSSAEETTSGSGMEDKPISRKRAPSKSRGKIQSIGKRIKLDDYKRKSPAAKRVTLDVPVKKERKSKKSDNTELFELRNQIADNLIGCDKEVMTFLGELMTFVSYLTSKKKKQNGK